MLTPTPGSDAERRLRALFRALSPADRDTLLAFAEFLNQRVVPSESVQQLEAPRAISRPMEESVVAAIKRLKQQYPMLDATTMLDETSALMSAHVLQGQPATTVIDELESLFARRYDAYQAGFTHQD